MGQTAKRSGWEAVFMIIFIAIILNLIFEAYKVPETVRKNG